MLYKLILVGPVSDLEHDTWILTLPATIGRNPDHGVCVNHESISRSHCQLLLNSQGALMVRDMHSTNGTYVRDKRVTQCEIFPGDMIQVGAVSFRVEYESDTDHGRPAPRPKSFDLSTTKPMRTLEEEDLPKSSSPTRKWWEFWK